MAVISAVGRKLPRSKPKVWSRWIHWQSDTSLLRPGTFLTCRALTRSTEKPRASSMSKSGIQYTPVDSIATVSTSHAVSQSARSMSACVKLLNSRTGCSARSGGTATQWLPDPMSIPAALRCTRSRNFCSRVLRFERRGGRVVCCVRGIGHSFIVMSEEHPKAGMRRRSTLLNGITPCVSPMMFSRHPRAMLSNGGSPTSVPSASALGCFAQATSTTSGAGPVSSRCFATKGRVGWLSSCWRMPSLGVQYAVARAALDYNSLGVGHYVIAQVDCEHHSPAYRCRSVTLVGAGG